jgi:hypothetical protein
MVSFDEEKGIIMIRVIGSATHEDHCAVRNEAVRLCKSSRCSKLLVDLRELTTERSSTMDCFSFGESVASVPQHFRVAHVLPRDAKSAGDVRFTSIVEANRGKITREFGSIEEAEQWLIGE